MEKTNGPQCFHPSFMSNECTWCNKHINDCGDLFTTPFRYIHPELTLTLLEVDHVRDDNLRHLLHSKKLQLVLDLDKTLIHSILTTKLTSEDRQRIEAVEDVYEILSGEYKVKLRPGVREFIKKVSSMFDVSIYTMATRPYAQEVHRILESNAGFPSFSWVIAREDCVNTKQKSLDVVLSQERVVLIVDDTEHVWDERCKRNLVKIDRYEFFTLKKGLMKGGVQELARVYSVLKEAHEKFYDDNFKRRDKFYDGWGYRDVREVLETTFKNSILREGSSESCCLSQEDGDGSVEISSKKRSRDRISNVDTSLVTAQGKSFPHSKSMDQKYLLND